MEFDLRGLQSRSATTAAGSGISLRLFFFQGFQRIGTQGRDIGRSRHFQDGESGAELEGGRGGGVMEKIVENG